MNGLPGQAGGFDIGKVVIRPCREEDIRFLHAVHSASVQAFCMSHYTPDQLDGWLLDDSDDRYRASGDDDTVLLVAASGTQICAFGAVDLSIAQLKSLFVHPAAAGYGIGSRLLHDLENAALAGGVDGLDVDASLNAVSFYEQHGYRAGAECIFTFASGAQVPCVHMHKTLAKNIS